MTYTRQFFRSLFLLLFGSATTFAAAPIPIELDPSRSTDLQIETVGGGEYRLITTGAASQVYTKPITGDVDPENHTVLSFEYFAVQNVNLLIVYPGPVVTRDFRLVGSMPLAEGWSEVTVDLTSIDGQRIQPDFGFFRLHFAGRAEIDFRVRNIRLRAASADEIRQREQRDAMLKADLEVSATIADYLRRIYHGFLTEAFYQDDTIVIRGTVPEGYPAALIELPLWKREFKEGALNAGGLRTHPVDAGNFELSLPRFPGAGEDRLLYRYALVHESENGRELLSAVRWVDPTPFNEPPRIPRPDNIKGMGGLDAKRVAEYLELGVANVGINVLLASYLLPSERPGAIRWDYAGETFWMNPEHVAKLDEQMRIAREANLAVNLVLLVERPQHIHFPEIRRFVHPDFTSRGIHAMPNVTDPIGQKLYAAVMDFLSARYDGSSDEFAPVRDWVVHNEVDAGIVWTNAGEKSMGNYMDLYHRSMRLMHNLVRVRQPQAEVHISLTHRWTESRQNIYAPRELLERLLEYSHLEGDFRWGIAQHPYPTNLFNPRTWEDPRTNFTLDTPLITFRNLEVLDYWIRLPENRYKGSKVRSLVLTEQGLNSWGLDEQALLDQAAGLAFAWHKIQRLESVRVFIYHRWVDHPNEGGLQLGLRQNAPGTTQQPGEKKPSWHVFQALGTEKEEEASAFALPIVGLESWDDIIRPVER